MNNHLLFVSIRYDLSIYLMSCIGRERERSREFKQIEKKESTTYLCTVTQE